MAGRRKGAAEQTYAICAFCQAEAPRPWGHQTPAYWASQSLKPVGPLVEFCCRECSEAWAKANTELLEAWGRWYDTQFVERKPA